MTSAPTASLPVVVIGEALTDVIDEADGSSNRHPGGSPMNVAFGLARLGVPTRFVTQLGDDRDGRAIRSHLAEVGVELAVASSPRTSSAVATLDEHGSARYDFDIDWSLGVGDIDVPTGTPLVHIGSIGALRTPGADSVEAAVTGRAQGTLVSFDPNVRPDVLGAHSEVVERVKRLVRVADIVKMSDEDAAWLYPGTSPAEVVESLLRQGVRLAAITLGDAGCLIGADDETFALPAAETSVVDTVGAGDSFMAGLLRAVLMAGRGATDEPGREALLEWGGFALACAGVTVSRRGALPPTLAELGT